MLFAYLTTSSELGQFFKFHSLITHYQEHKAENQSITVWQFLIVHYASADEVDADYHKDMQLPFKSHSECGHLLVMIPDFTDYSSFILDGFSLTSNPIPNYWAIYNNSIADNIWQPPQFS